MQENVLEKHPSADLRVYTVWMPVLRRDSRGEADVSRLLLNDRRVRHLWNSDLSIGVWFKENVTPEYDGRVQWDAYFLYGSDASWEEIPAPLISWGRTVLGESETLESGIEWLFDKQNRVD